MIYRLLLVISLLMIAGGEYFLTGFGLLMLSMYLSGTSSSGRGGEVLTAIVAITGALGVIAVFVQFAWERLT